MILLLNLYFSPFVLLVACGRQFLPTRGESVRILAENCEQVCL